MKAKKSALGRGLDVLLPDVQETNGGVQEIGIMEIDRNPEQPRRLFDEEALQSLADSIREAGILQPLLVVEEMGRYRIIAGERRFRAARLAGLTTVPCIVRSMSQQEQMEAALIENIQREDLNAIEEARAIRQLMENAAYTQEQAATRLGKSRPAVSNLLRLLNLPEAVQQMVIDNQLSAGHARVLAGLSGEHLQLSLAEKTIREGLSVRTLEKLAAMPPMPGKEPSQPKPLPLELQDMENRMRNTFGVRAQIKGNAKKGKIILEYCNADELEKVYQCMEMLENM